MKVFDSLIVADWPRGLYLAQQLALRGQTIAYLYQKARPQNPFALFLEESASTEKQFFNTLGQLDKQEGGFCLLTNHGVWPLQKRKALGLIPPKSRTPSFGEDFLFYLSHQLAGKVFESNDSLFRDQSLDLFGDYFLFDPDLKKIQYFKQQYPNIHFFEEGAWNYHTVELKPGKKKAPHQIFISKGSQREEFLAHKLFAFYESVSRPEAPIYWQWQAFHYEVDFKEYQESLPSHIVCINNLLFPWCYDNLLSLFHKNQRLELWMKLKPGADSKASFWTKKAQQVLEPSFPGVPFSLQSLDPIKSFCVYGAKGLDAPLKKNQKGLFVPPLQEFFQGDLASEVRNEILYSQKLLE